MNDMKLTKSYKEWYDNEKKIHIIISGKLLEHCATCPNVTGYVEIVGEQGEKMKVEVKPMKCPCTPTICRAHIITKQTADVIKEAGRWQEYIDAITEEI